MRKLLVLLVGLIGLAMGLSGCIAGAYKNTLVKDKYIQDYVSKNAKIKPKKVGDSDIKFYVAKITDARKGHKYIWLKNGLFGIPAGKTKIDNLTLTLTNLTKKALVNTGWGVTDDNTKADYLINIKVNSLGDYKGFFIGHRRVDITTTVNNRTKRTVIKKDLRKSIPVFINGVDLKAQFKFVAGKNCTVYYELLTNFFGSKEFKDAIMRDYLSHLPSVDNATSSVDNATE